MAYNAGPFGVRVHLFINNPPLSVYPGSTPAGGYDVLTDDDGNYSVPYNRVSIGSGDVAVVYRAEPHATKRDPGYIVGVARITSSPWELAPDQFRVDWTLRLLPRKAWISSGDMKASGLWSRKVPFSPNEQVANPVEQDAPRWGWLSARLPGSTVAWLDKHAARFAP